MYLRRIKGFPSKVQIAVLFNPKKEDVLRQIIYILHKLLGD